MACFILMSLDIAERIILSANMKPCSNQEEVLSAGGSRKDEVEEPLWIPLSVPGPIEMASLTAGWGALERSPARAPGLPGWRNGALKVTCMP